MMATLNPEPEGERMGIARRLAQAYKDHPPLISPSWSGRDLPRPPRDVCYDTEFIDDGRTIELISIGAVDQGNHYYAVNAEVDQERILRHPFLREHVWPKLPLRDLDKPYKLTLQPGEYERSDVFGPPGAAVEILVTKELDLDDPRVKPKEQIRDEFLDFLVPKGVLFGPGAAVRLWAWFASYDHVALAQLFGPMVALPQGVPMRTGDLAQEADRLGVAKEQMPPQDERFKHHALHDAEHDWVMMHFLRNYARENRRV